MMKVRLASVMLVAAFLVSGCASDNRARDERYEGSTAASGRADLDLEFEVTEMQVIWARGVGRLGFVKTCDVSEPPDEPVELHFVEDMDFRKVGWIANSGKAVRYKYYEPAMASAHRTPFEEIELPVDTLENQVRRIFALDPLHEIRILQATEADLRK